MVGDKCQCPGTVILTKTPPTVSDEFHLFITPLLPAGPVLTQVEYEPHYSLPSFPVVHGLDSSESESLFPRVSRPLHDRWTGKDVPCRVRFRRESRDLRHGPRLASSIVSSKKRLTHPPWRTLGVSTHPVPCPVPRPVPWYPWSLRAPDHLVLNDTSGPPRRTQTRLGSLSLWSTFSGSSVSLSVVETVHFLLSVSHYHPRRDPSVSPLTRSLSHPTDDPHPLYRHSVCIHIRSRTHCAPSIRCG